MVNKCCVVCCTSNYLGGEVVPVFTFPKDDDLRTLWIRYVNRNFWTVTKSSVICLKHFEKKLVHKGASEKRYRLLYNLKPVLQYTLLAQQLLLFQFYLDQENHQLKKYFKKIIIRNSYQRILLKMLIPFQLLIHQQDIYFQNLMIVLCSIKLFKMNYTYLKLLSVFISTKIYISNFFIKIFQFPYRDGSE